MFSQEQYIRINGYSNRYFGWGGEDDDLYHRLKAVGYQMARYTQDVARYRSFGTGHKRAPANKERSAQATQSLLMVFIVFSSVGIVLYFLLQVCHGR